MRADRRNGRPGALVAAVASAVFGFLSGAAIIAAGLPWPTLTVAPVLALAVYDVLQRRHAVLRNFPVLGRARYVIERLGPEMRQYIVASDTEERPFSRDERRWVYASAKRQPNAFGFGTDLDLEHIDSHLIIKPVGLPDPSAQVSAPPLHEIACGKVLGAARGRAGAFTPSSVINVSGMSFGALSSPAVEALNRGALAAGALHNIGEGGLADAHRHGAELIFQIGTGYFGCRDERGRFSVEHLKDTIAGAPVRALEIKLSQGAKGGLGGHLPAIKVTPEIARIRGVPVGQDCTSPAGHSVFRTPDELLDFVEMLAAETGLPVGIKSAVGDELFWIELARLQARTGRGVDYVCIDGGEGGTGSAPLAFANHVALPFKLGFSRVYRIFAEEGLTDDIVFAGSGKLGFPQAALFAFALGCDLVNVGRTAMLSAGCIQAQRCHTGHCPAGLATQKPWLMRGLDPNVKHHRVANYLIVLRSELAALCRACGVDHPAQVSPDQLELLTEHFGARTVRDVFGYPPGLRP